jgi:hypothetical protein
MTRKYTLHPYIDKLVHPEIVMLKMHCNGPISFFSSKYNVLPKSVIWVADLLHLINCHNLKSKSTSSLHA